MYEVSEQTREADDVLWGRLRVYLAEQGIDAPATLARPTGALIEHWLRSDLLISQTCGYPYTRELAPKGVRVIGTPVYTTNDDLKPGDYRSVIVVSAKAKFRSLKDVQGRTAGVNDLNSNSGMNAFRATVALAFSAQELRKGIFAAVRVTGSHLNSLRMVASGAIDVAAIDSVTYDLIARDHPEIVKKTRILAYSPPSPGLPLITSKEADDARLASLRSALLRLFAAPQDDKLRQALGALKLKNIVFISNETYFERIDALEKIAYEKGYANLR